MRGGFSLWVYQVSHFVIVLMLSYENISFLHNVLIYQMETLLFQAGTS